MNTDFKYINISFNVGSFYDLPSVSITLQNHTPDNHF